MPFSYNKAKRIVREKRIKLLKNLFIVFVLLGVIASFASWKYQQKGAVEGIKYRRTADKDFLLERIEYFKEHKPHCYNLIKRVSAYGLNVGIRRHLDRGYTMAVSYEDGGKYLLKGRSVDLPLIQLITSLLKEGDNYIEVGASHGSIALNAAKAVGVTGKVHAYEPTGYIGDITIPLSACFSGFEDRVSSAKFAIGNKRDRVKFNEYGKTNIYANSILLDKRSEEDHISDVPMITLDSLHADEKINLLRVNVQGSECNVFQGATKVLRSPDLLISFDWEPELLESLTQDFDPKKCIGYLQKAGFKHFWEVRGYFQSDKNLADSDVYLEKISIDEIINMTDSIGEFIASKKPHLPKTQ